jgi:anthranilate phosphoribosyltransferase
MNESINDISINWVLGHLSAGEDLSRDQMATAIGQVMTGAWSEEQIGLLLTALAAKGETVAEVAGAASAMRDNMTPIRSRHKKLLDTCGTGGGGSTTFNISTSAALVIAAVGVPLAKHGNRSVTSKSGSADVLAELGVNIQADVQRVERCLDELGICFCFAPLMHPAMKHVGAVRRKLGIRTIFNLLGPLANPAGATNQLLGVGVPELRPLIASSLAMLGTERALVVSGGNGLGEVSLAGPTEVTQIDGGGERAFTWQPDDFGLQPSSLETIQVTNPAESAAIVRSVLAGEPGPARDIVLLNAAAGLLAAGHCESPQAGVSQAAEAIDRGAAATLLKELAQLSHDAVD